MKIKRDKVTLQSAILESLEKMKKLATFSEVAEHIRQNNSFDFSGKTNPEIQVSTVLGNFIRNGNLEVGRIKIDKIYQYYLTKYQDMLGVNPLQMVVVRRKNKTKKKKAKVKVIEVKVPKKQKAQKPPKEQKKLRPQLLNQTTSQRSTYQVEDLIKLFIKTTQMFSEAILSGVEAKDTIKVKKDKKKEAKVVNNQKPVSKKKRKGKRPRIKTAKLIISSDEKEKAVVS